MTKSLYFSVLTILFSFAGDNLVSAQVYQSIPHQPAQNIVLGQAPTAITSHGVPLVVPQGQLQSHSARVIHSGATAQYDTQIVHHHGQTSAQGTIQSSGGVVHGNIIHAPGMNAGNASYQSASGNQYNGGYTVQSPSQVNVNAGFHTTNGNSGTAQISRNNGVHSGSGTLNTAAGDAYHANYNYHNPNHMNVQGGVRSADGTVIHGGMTRQDGRHTGNVTYETKSGPTYQGNYDYRGVDQFSAGGQYGTTNGTGYGGNVTRDGNRTIVAGNHHRPGHIPGTQERYHGVVDVNGQHSQVTAGGELFDASGNQRFGGASSTLSGRQVSASQDSGVGNVHGTNNQSVRFQGVNSTYTYGQTARMPGVNAKATATVNRNQVSGNYNMNVFGQNMGGHARVNSNGVHISGTGPNVSLPRIPTTAIQKSAPKPLSNFKWHYTPLKPLTTPSFSYSAPKVTTPTFDTSKLKFKPYQPPKSNVNRASSSVRNTAKQTGSRISRSAKSAGGSISRNAKSAGGSVSRNGKAAVKSFNNAAQSAGGAISSGWKAFN